MDDLANKKYCFVSVDLSSDNVDKPFLYAIDENLSSEIKIGDKVKVPFGKGDREREAYILEILTKKELERKPLYYEDPFFKKEGALDNLKYVKEILKNKIGVNNILLDMAIYMSEKYMCNLSICLKACTPVKKVIRKNSRTIDKIEKYEKEEKVIDFNDDQKKVIEDLKSDYDKKDFSEHLIHGITGSGKTEVYIEMIKYAIKDNKKVIVLIPEISLTYQTVIRLKQVFGTEISIIHSRMSDGEKYIQYKKCLDNKSKILVGPRSAVFAPFSDLGLVVIDEVHDRSYKSDISPRYHTLDVARFRCKKQNAMLLTLSATPQVTYYYEAKNSNEKIKIHSLKERAVKDATLPEIHVVDMRKEFKEKNTSSFSKTLKNLIDEKLERHEQIMLYMNKRGMSRMEKCIDCGETIKCPHCDVSLVVHRDNTAKCHYCGYEEKVTHVCPACHGEHVTTFGMGTEKLEEKVKEEFPTARVLRMDKDTTMKKDGMDEIIKKFRNNEADILIGTQMIVKGHDFPNVTLVGIMCADMSLYMPTYKATEDTFDILMQMEGRSGRNKKGDSVIQTYDTESYGITSAIKQNYEDFYEKEIRYRKMLSYPPFSTMLTCMIKSNNEDYAREILSSLTLKIKSANIDKAQILGPNKATPYKVKDIYRYIYYIKCNNEEEAFLYRKLIHDYIVENDYLKGLSTVFDIE